jgi:hypothetical protein
MPQAQVEAQFDERISPVARRAGRSGAAAVIVTWAVRGLPPRSGRKCVNGD